MEKNLAENNSDSLAHKAEDDLPNDDTPNHSSEPVAVGLNNTIDVKLDSDETEKVVEDWAEKVVEHPDQVESEQEHPKDDEEKTKEQDEEEGKEEDKDKDKEEEKEKEETVVEAPPESPPPSFERVSEEIDELILNLQKHGVNDEDNKEGTTSATLESPGFILKFMDLMDQKLAKYEAGEVKWRETTEEESSFLESVNRISRLFNQFNEYCQSHQHDEGEEEKERVMGKADFLMNGIGAIQQRAMSFLEEEFRTIMEDSNKGNQQHEGSESETPAEMDTEFPNFSEETVTALGKIAREMIAGGYENECCHVYAISRRHAIEDAMHKLLAYEKITIDEVQKMPWEALEREIPTWINTWKEITTVWLVGEQKLANAVFADEASTLANLYGNLNRGIAMQLLNFAESVAMTKRAGEKLFKMLDLYETLRDAIPNMDALFPDDISGEMKTETISGKCRLGEAAVQIFCDLENSIKSDNGKTPVAGGAVHPLTRYIMNYLRLACEYKDTLEEVFKEHSRIERADSTSRPHYDSEDSKPKNRSENVSPFAGQLMRVMELLDSNLEGKAKLYKEVALSCIFMMNNGRYIVQKIKGSAEIYEVMGETWCRKRSTELRTYHKNYQVETWSKILSYLSPKGLNDNGKLHKPVLKERFKSFNAAFEEIHKTQSTWVVSDEQLQSELRVSISALVIPAYRSFLGRFSQYLDPGRQTEKYIKYQAEDVETYIDDLFDGNPHGRR